MVEGLDRFNRRWKSIPKNARINVRAAMEDAATDIVEEMWLRAPYDDGVLAASIGWTWGEAPAGSLTIGTVGGREYGAMRITIFAGGGDAFYAWFQEFGTQDMPANPFFYPVWRVRRKNVRSRISRAISKAIRES
ncbi:HK97 gp10 family phage protein [Shimia sp. R9_2]|uniref:HK97-gp10 family putative phage morphogenesis protein n=1 Tax=Shimia sp. R9_2 TaxID=2821112 RepID=UPI001AD98EF2|nr:HK97-gp10 family putative phage morphogenesis protein [Shimia sp. R9_2]MBO9398735.1 HK97 gp10 family phage protein [Shimia sp. R9_2]